jgi:hypothetical protein
MQGRELIDVQLDVSCLLSPVSCLLSLAEGALWMDVRRRFVAALIVFALWVATLGALAVVSGREPPRHPAAPMKADR